MLPGPGIELDRLVAEKIFGWRRLPYKSRWTGEQTWYYEALEGCNEEDVQTPPQYSANLNVAFHILKKFDYICLVKSPNSSEWRCRISLPKQRPHNGVGKTPAHAICKAALSAMNGTIKAEAKNELSDQMERNSNKV